MIENTNETEMEISDTDIYGAMENLDLSWLAEEEQLLDPLNYVLKPLERIPVFLLYLNTDNMEVAREKTYLDVVVFHSPEHTYSILDKTKLLECVDANQRRYSLFDIQLFHFSITEDKVQAFSSAEIDSKLSKKYLKELSPNTNQKQWIIEPTILLFHDLCELFVFYKELPPPTITTPPKSILKTGVGLSNSITKKVRIQLHSPDEKMKTQPVNKTSTTTSTKHRTTRKILIL